MADATISRRYRDFDIVLHTATSLATTLDVRDVAGAIVSFGTMSTNTSTLQMFVSPTRAGSFSRLYKADGSIAALTLAPSSTEARSYSLPDEVFAAPFIKLVLNNTAANGLSAIILAKG
jgi:hypothetical protein